MPEWCRKQKTQPCDPKASRILSAINKRNKLHDALLSAMQFILPWARPKPEIDSFVLQQGFCQHIRNLPFGVSPHWLSLPAGPTWGLRACSQVVMHAVHRMLEDLKAALAWQHRFKGSLRSAASGGAVKHAESSWHVVAGQHVQEIEQSSSAFSVSVWRFQFALRVSFMHWKGSPGSWKSQPNLTWHNRGKWARKRCQPLQNQNKGRRGRELPHSSCASLGRGRHAQSCAKSPWNSSHHLLPNRWIWFSWYFILWQVFTVFKSVLFKS